MDDKVKEQYYKKEALNAEIKGDYRTAQKMKSKTEKKGSLLLWIIVIILLFVLYLIYNGTIDISPILANFGINKP